MIESEFTFLEMQVEPIRPNASPFRHRVFAVPQKQRSMMLPIAHINQPVVAAPAGQGRDFRCLQVEGNQSDELPKLGTRLIMTLFYCTLTRDQ